MYRFSAVVFAVVVTIFIIGCAEESANIVEVEQPNDNIVGPTGTATIHNPSESDLQLLNRTRLLSPDRKVYRIVGQTHVPAQGKMIITIITDDRTDFDLSAGVRLSIPGLSGYEEFKGVSVVTNTQALG